MATPTVTGINPGSGPPGTQVVITGSNFGEDVYEVKFGTYDVGTNFVVVSETDLIAYVPSGTGTDLNVTVKNGDGTGTLTSGWDYATYIGGPGGTGGSAPTVTGIVPTQSAYEDGRGGDSVVITGTKFATTFVVWFGDVPSPSFTIDSDTQVTAIAPPGGGEVEVDVENSYGRSADPGTANDFTYPEVDVPVVTSISPTGGTVNTIVTITGDYFATANSVTFNTRSPVVSYDAAFTVLSDETIRAYAPEGPVANNTVDILVSSPSGTATDPGAGNDFTYLATPTNLRIVPGIGHVTLFWDEVASASPVTYEVYGGATPTPTIVIAVTGATVMTIKQDYADGTKYYGVKTVDVFGNRSAMSNIVSGVALMTVADEIAEEAINSMKMFAAGIRPPVVVDTLPTLPETPPAEEFPVGTMVFLTTDRRLYRNSGGGPNTNTHTNKGTWYDLVGTNNGTLDGFAYTTASGWKGTGTGADPYCLAFDYVDDHVDLTAITETNDKVYTLEGWARNTTDCAHTGYIIWHGWDSGTQYCGLGTSSGLRPVTIQKDSSATVTSMPSGDWGCDDGNWHHYVATCDGSTQKVYMDGVLADSDTVAGGTFNATDTSLIGRHGVGAGGGYWDGDIACVRVYSAALTLAQIVQNFKVGPTGEGYYATDLVHHWNTKRSLEADAWSPMVDAGEMSGVISGNTIIGNSITAGMIAAGAIGATEIAADSLMSRSMFIGSFDNLMPNPNSELDPGNRDTTSTASDYEFRCVTTTNAYAGSKCRRLIGVTTGTTSAILTPFIPVLPDESYYFECRARLGSAVGSGRVKLLCYKQDKSTVIETVATDDVTAASYGTTIFKVKDGSDNPWYDIPATVGADGAAYIQIQLETTDIGSANYLYVDEMFLRRRLLGELIVDGTITTEHLDATGISCDVLDGGTINGQTITGGIFKTETSGERIEILTANRSQIDFYTGHASEDTQGTIVTDSQTSEAYLTLSGPIVYTSGLSANLSLIGYTSGVTRVKSQSDYIELIGTQTAEIKLGSTSNPYLLMDAGANRVWLGNNSETIGVDIDADTTTVKTYGALKPGDNWSSGTSDDGIWIQDKDTVGSRWKMYFGPDTTPRLYLRNGSTWYYVTMTLGS